MRGRWALTVAVLVGAMALPLLRTSGQTAPATARGPAGGAAANAEVFPKLPVDQPAPRMRADGPNSGWLQRHERLATLAKQGNIDVYFEGDSITDFWAGRQTDPRGRNVWNYYYAPIKAANFGISADNIEHVLYRITNGEFDGVKPKVVVMLIGTNNFGHAAGTTPEEVQTGIKHLIETMQVKSPTTKVLLLGIFPRVDRTATTNNLMAKIKAANALLAKLDNGTTIRFLDIGAEFLAADGSLPTDVMADGLHPTEKGYRIWAEAMNPTLFGMLGMPVPAVMPAEVPATVPTAVPAARGPASR